MAKVVLNGSTFNGYTTKLSLLTDAQVKWLADNYKEDDFVCSFVNKISKKDTDYLRNYFIRCFEHRRDNELLVKCIEENPGHPYYLEEYDDTLFHARITTSEYSDDYSEKIELIPRLNKKEVLTLMKALDFDGLVEYLEARDIEVYTSDN